MKLVTKVQNSDASTFIMDVAEQNKLEVSTDMSLLRRYDISIIEHENSLVIESMVLNEKMIVESFKQIPNVIHLVVQVHHAEIEKQSLLQRLYVVKCRDLALTKKIDILNEKIIYDFKLNCYNYSFFERQIKVEFDKYTRYNEPFSLIMLDLDQFKGLNDTLGHAEGDVVLQKVCDVMQKTVRVADSVYRFGGDEFAILLHNSLYMDALITAERVRKAIYNLQIIYKMKTGLKRVACSIGICTVSSEEIMLGDIAIKDIIEYADKALYEAKRKGKNRSIHYADKLLKLEKNK